jgi:hypothetical protein
VTMGQRTKPVLQANPSAGGPKAGIAAFALTAGKLTFAIDVLLTASDTSERIGNHPSRSVQTLDVRKATVM